MREKFQTALRLIYPPRCLCCGDVVESEFGLCGPCWRDTPFITGLTCDACGVPLMGEPGGGPELCDECLATPRPWSRGRAVMLYRDNGRRLVMDLKHGDRHEIARGAGRWMANTGRAVLQGNPLVAPVPLHWTRLLKRRFNQAALLSQGVAEAAGVDHCPDLLIRPMRTRPTKGQSRDERYDLMQGSIAMHPKRAHLARGRHVVLIDDVMTTGATLTAASDACLAAGACDVSTLVLARVVNDP